MIFNDISFVDFDDIDFGLAQIDKNDTMDDLVFLYLILNTMALSSTDNKVNT